MPLNAVVAQFSPTKMLYGPRTLSPRPFHVSSPSQILQLKLGLHNSVVGILHSLGHMKNGRIWLSEHQCERMMQLFVNNCLLNQTAFWNVYGRVPSPLMWLRRMHLITANSQLATIEYSHRLHPKGLCDSSRSQTPTLDFSVDSVNPENIPNR